MVIKRNYKIGLLFGNFESGGAEKMMINLAKGFQNRGNTATIYVVNDEGPYRDKIPSNVKVKSFNANFGVKSVFCKIRNLLSNNDLDLLLVTQPHIVTTVALATLGIKNRPKLIFRQEDVPSQNVSLRILRYLYKFSYKRADSIIAVSTGVKKDLIKYYELDPEKIDVIYNPVIDSEITKYMMEEPTHQWLRDGKKMTTIISIGRLARVKDYPTLIKAFRIVRNKIKSRLIIFGETRDREYYNFIKDLIKQNHLNSSVDLAGYTSNPYAHLVNSDLLVLSSKSEGFGNVIVEALACGCPVVSTDCRSGPAEILDNGKYGKLTPVGNHKKLASAILESLQNNIEKNKLKKRANKFSLENSTNKHLELFKKVMLTKQNI